jgi:chromosome segregation ATPase
MSGDVANLRSGISRMKREVESQKRDIKGLRKERDLLLERSKYLSQKLAEAYAVYEEAGRRILDFTEKETGPLKGSIKELADELRKNSKEQKEWKHSLESRLGEVVKGLERADASSFQRLESMLDQAVKRIESNENLCRKISSELGEVGKEEDATDRKLAEFRTLAERRMKEDRASLEGVLEEFRKETGKRDTAMKARLESAEARSRSLSRTLEKTRTDMNQKLDRAVSEFRKMLAETQMDEKRVENRMAEFKSFLEDRLKMNKDFFEKGLDRVAKDSEKINAASFSKLRQSLDRLDSRLTASEKATKQAEFMMKDFSRKLSETGLDEKRVESRFVEIRDFLEDNMKLTKDTLEKRIDSVSRESSRIASEAERSSSKGQKELEGRIANAENFASKLGVMLDGLKKDLASGLAGLDKRIGKNTVTEDTLSERIAQARSSAESMIRAAEDGLKKGMDILRDESRKGDSSIGKELALAGQKMNAFEKSLADLSARMRSDFAEFKRQLSLAKERDERNKQKTDDVRNVLDGLIKSEGSVFDRKLNDFSRLADKRMNETNSSLRTAQQRIERLDSMLRSGVITDRQLEERVSRLREELQEATKEDLKLIEQSRDEMERRLLDAQSSLKGFSEKFSSLEKAMQASSMDDKLFMDKVEALRKEIEKDVQKTNTFFDSVRRDADSFRKHISETTLSRKETEEKLDSLKDFAAKRDSEIIFSLGKLQTNLEKRLGDLDRAVASVNPRLAELGRKAGEESLKERTLKNSIESMRKELEKTRGELADSIGQQASGLLRRIETGEAVASGLSAKIEDVMKEMQGFKLDEKKLDSKIALSQQDIRQRLAGYDTLNKGLRKSVDEMGSTLQVLKMADGKNRESIKGISDILDSQIRELSSRVAALESGSRGMEVTAKQSEVAAKAAIDPEDIKARVRHAEGTVKDLDSRLADFRKRVDTIISDILDKVEAQGPVDAGMIEQLRKEMENRIKLNDQTMNAELDRMRKEFTSFMKDLAVVNEKQQERLYRIIKE